MGQDLGRRLVSPPWVVAQDARGQVAGDALARKQAGQLRERRLARGLGRALRPPGAVPRKHDAVPGVKHGLVIGRHVGQGRLAPRTRRVDQREHDAALPGAQRDDDGRLATRHGHGALGEDVHDLAGLVVDEGLEPVVGQPSEEGVPVRRGGREEARGRHGRAQGGRRRLEAEVVQHGHRADDAVQLGEEVQRVVGPRVKVRERPRGHLPAAGGGGPAGLGHDAVDLGPQRARARVHDQPVQAVVVGGQLHEVVSGRAQGLRVAADEGQHGHLVRGAPRVDEPYGAEHEGHRPQPGREFGPVEAAGLGQVPALAEPLVGHLAALERASDAGQHVRVVLERVPLGVGGAGHVPSASVHQGDQREAAPDVPGNQLHRHASRLVREHQAHEDVARPVAVRLQPGRGAYGRQARHQVGQPAQVRLAQHDLGLQRPLPVARRRAQAVATRGARAHIIIIQGQGLDRQVRDLKVRLRLGRNSISHAHPQEA